MARMVHSLVAKTAKEIAASAWEAMSSNDDFHKAWPKERRFVQCNWHEFLGYARMSLVTMLKHKPGTENNPNGPEYYYSQHIRDEVFDALVIDGAHKATHGKSIAQIRAEAGADPLSEVLKSRAGRVLH